MRLNNRATLITLPSWSSFRLHQPVSVRNLWHLCAIDERHECACEWKIYLFQLYICNEIFIPQQRHVYQVNSHRLCFPQLRINLSDDASRINRENQVLLFSLYSLLSCYLSGNCRKSCAKRGLKNATQKARRKQKRVGFQEIHGELSDLMPLRQKHWSKKGIFIAVLLFAQLNVFVVLHSLNRLSETHAFSPPKVVNFVLSSCKFKFLTYHLRDNFLEVYRRKPSDSDRFSAFRFWIIYTF